MILTKVTSCSLPRKPKGAVRVIHGSDFHMLHPRTPSEVITDNLDTMLTPTLLSDADAFYVHGDYWDDSKQLRQEDSRHVIDWSQSLLMRCKQYDCALRLLEGTPSHDHHQSKIFLTLNKPIGANVAYLEGLGVYKDEVLGMDVGYVQDEHANTAAEVEKEMSEYLKTRSIAQVAFFSMHGMFGFQLPVFDVKSYNERFWTSRCTYGIFIGHDHKAKHRGKIRVTGSPDCLSFGEWGEKGITVTDFIDGKCYAYFVVNENAVPYVTVRDCLNDDELVEKSLEALRYVSEHPTGRYGRLRIIYPHDSNIEPLIKTWNKEYPFIVQGDKLPDPTRDIILEASFKAEETQETITEENIGRLLEGEMSELPYDKKAFDEIMCLIT